jgi:signal transduction histidine kinase
LRTRLLAALLLSSALLPALPPAANAAEFATKPEAEAMVAKALKYWKANGNDKTYAEIGKKDGQFTDRDLYVVIYGLDGTVRAHGANPKMIGKNLMEIRDVDGKFFVKERVEMAKKKQPFWQDYKFTNPTSGKIEPKTMYCDPEDDMVMCAGVYLK